MKREILVPHLPHSLLWDMLMNQVQVKRIAIIEYCLLLYSLDCTYAHNLYNIVPRKHLKGYDWKNLIIYLKLQNAQNINKCVLTLDALYTKCTDNQKDFAVTFLIEQILFLSLNNSECYKKMSAVL